MRVATAWPVDRRHPAGKHSPAGSLCARLHDVERRYNPSPVSRRGDVHPYRCQGWIGEQRMNLVPTHHEPVLVVAAGCADLDGVDLMNEAPQCRHGGLPSTASVPAS